jgi:hypothetical protein
VFFFMDGQPAAPDEGQKDERRNQFECGEPQTRCDHQQIGGSRREACPFEREPHRAFANADAGWSKYGDEPDQVRARENCHVASERARRDAEHALREQPERNAVHEPRHAREHRRRYQHTVREWPEHDLSFEQPAGEQSQTRQR